jgi:hypothetical protein
VKRFEVRRRLAQDQRAAGDVVTLIARKVRPNTQAIVPRDQMVDFHEKCRDIFVPGILALEGTQISNAQFGDGDACDIPRKPHSQWSGLTLDIGSDEVERAIRHERPAGASATRIPNEPGRRISERIVGGEVVMSQDIREGAVPVVTSRFRDDIHQAAGGSP